MNAPTTQNILGTIEGGTFHNECDHEYWTYKQAQFPDENEMHRAVRQLSSQGLEQEEGSEETYRLCLQRVGMDLAVLDLMQQVGVRTEQKAQFCHWANFKDELASRRFTKWLDSQGYEFESLVLVGSEFLWTFTHIGCLNQKDICQRTVALAVQAAAVGGNYDGWETSLKGVRIGGSSRPALTRLPS